MSYVIHTARRHRLARQAHDRTPVAPRASAASKWPMPLSEALAIGLGCDNYKHR